MKRIFKILLSFPRTVWFNLRYLPLTQALKLPVWIAPNVRVKKMWRGGIQLSKVSTGILHIGYHEADAVDVYSAHTILDINNGGVVCCKGSIHIGQGAILCVKSTGNLFLGQNFAISGTSTIVCTENISFGDNVQLSWNSLIMDSDAHSIIDSIDTLQQKTLPVIIGSHVWIAANVTILKGVYIANNCVVAGNSLLNKKYDTDNALIAGVPARIIKHIKTWRI